jgi:hypothetical protein
MTAMARGNMMMARDRCVAGDGESRADRGHA